MLGDGVVTSKVETQMGVDVNITDVQTGHILIAENVSRSYRQGRTVSVGGVSLGSAKGDSFADVQRIIASVIAEALVVTRNPFKVIVVQVDGTLIVNYGAVFLPR